MKKPKDIWQHAAAFYATLFATRFLWAREIVLVRKQEG